jgi:hypothetical protein
MILSFFGSGKGTIASITLQTCTELDVMVSFAVETFRCIGIAWLGIRGV